MHDIALALMAVQTQTTEVLDSFPTIPVTQEAEQILKEIEQEILKEIEQEPWRCRNTSMPHTTS